MANDKPKDNGPPIQLLNININPIKLINTTCPAVMFAYKRISSANGLMKIPKISIGTRMI